VNAAPALARATTPEPAASGSALPKKGIRIMSDNVQSTAVDTEELRALISDALELPIEAVTDEARFKEDLDVDSLMALEIAVRLEKRYGVKVDDNELGDVSSLTRVHELLRVKLDAGT
jgi:acyl carrier protein